MIQFYFLSIVMNLIAGVALSIDYFQGKFSGPDHLAEFYSRSNVRLIFGALTFLIGFFKLLTVIAGDIPVVGDFLPAIAGLAMGMSLLLQYYKEKSTVTTETFSQLEKIFVENKTAIGIAGIIIALLHFFFPKVLFL